MIGVGGTGTLIKTLTDRVGMVGVEIIQRVIDGTPGGRLASLSSLGGGGTDRGGEERKDDPLEIKELMDHPFVKSLLLVGGRSPP